MFANFSSSGIKEIINIVLAIVICLFGVVAGGFLGIHPLFVVLGAMGLALAIRASQDRMLRFIMRHRSYAERR
jgi:hypothetical protein